jgi:hypothetical protein
MPVEFCLQQRLATGHNRNVLLDILFSVSTLKKLDYNFSDRSSECLFWRTWNDLRLVIWLDVMRKSSCQLCIYQSRTFSRQAFIGSIWELYKQWQAQL